MTTIFFNAYLEEDTGRFDSVTNNGRIIVEGVSQEQTWWLSLDGGSTWTTRTGTYVDLPEGRHNVVVKSQENEYPQTLGVINVDQTAPLTPTAEFSANGQYVTGQTESYATVKLYASVNGELQQIATATAGSDGRYSMRIDTLSNAEQLQVVAFDQALNASETILLAAPLIVENLLVTADNHAYLNPTFWGTPTVNPLQQKTSFSLLTADLGPILSADVVTKVFGAALHFDVADQTQRQLTLKAQSGGVQVAAMYDLHIYKLNAVTGEWVSQHVESNWLKAILLGGVSSDFDITLDAGQYMMVLGNGLGVAAVTGYTLKTIADTTFDLTAPTFAEGNITGNVLTDIDLDTGLDVLPVNSAIYEVQVINAQGDLDTYLVGAQGEYAVQGLYGVLYIQSEGTYRYEIDPDFNLTQAVVENFSYEVTTSSGAKSTANLTVHINAKDVPDSSIDHYLVVEPEPSIYAGEALGKVVDFSILDVDLLNPILGADALAFKGAMSFNVADQTLRELTFKGASGGIEIGSKYDLVIYKLDAATGHFVQHHVVEDWFKVILFGGGSVETTLSFTPGEYKVVLAGKTLIGALKGTAVKVVEDIVQDYGEPIAQTVKNPFSGDLTAAEHEQVLKVNQSILKAEGITEVQGKFGSLYIGRDGSYQYELDTSSTAAYGQIESFSYLVRSDDGSQRIEVINIQIDSQHASADLNQVMLETSNKVFDAVHEDSPHRKSYDYSFKVDANTQTDIELSVKVLSLLGDKRYLEYTLTNTTTGQVQQGMVKGKNPNLEQFKFADLSAGDYVLSLNLDSTSGLAGTITGVIVKQHSVYLSEFVAEQQPSVTGNLLANDLVSQLTSISVGEQHIYTGAGPQSMAIEGQYGRLYLEINGDYRYESYGQGSGIERFEYSLNSAVGSQNQAVLEIEVSQHIQGSTANEMVTNSSAQDQLHLGAGQDTLIFEVLDDVSPSAGHGLTTWHDFHAAQGSQDQQADAIDVGALLQDANSSNIVDYVAVDYDAASQTVTLSIDRDGQGQAFHQQAILKLTQQSQALSLDDLIQNQQILF